jgi:translation initiation factor IF-3
LRSNNIVRIACFSSEQTKTLPPSKNPKQKTSPKITLLSAGNQIEITTLDQAKKIAERRQLKLVSILDFDAKTQRAVYK